MPRDVQDAIRTADAKIGNLVSLARYPYAAYRKYEGAAGVAVRASNLRMHLLAAADRLSSGPAQVIPSIGQGYLATSDTSPLVKTLTLFNQVRARPASLEQGGWVALLRPP